MEKSSGGVMQKIEERRLKLEEALAQYERQIDQALAKLSGDLSEQINAVQLTLKKDTAKRESKLSAELSKQRKLLIYLLPTALILGLLIGIFATLSLHRAPAVEIPAGKIVTGQDGTRWIRLQDLPHANIAKER